MILQLLLFRCYISCLWVLWNMYFIFPMNCMVLPSFFPLLFKNQCNRKRKMCLWLLFYLFGVTGTEKKLQAGEEKSDQTTLQCFERSQCGHYGWLVEGNLLQAIILRVQGWETEQLLELYSHNPLVAFLKIELLGGKNGNWTKGPLRSEICMWWNRW